MDIKIILYGGLLLWEPKKIKEVDLLNMLVLGIQDKLKLYPGKFKLFF
jgi:hypothetical protein